MVSRLGLDVLIDLPSYHCLGRSSSALRSAVPASSPGVPCLRELHLSGRDQDYTEEKASADFQVVIPLLELETFSIDRLHPVTIRSLLGSIQAVPSYILILDFKSLVDQWEEVVETTLLIPSSHPLLPEFTTSPNELQFTGLLFDKEDGTLPFVLDITSDRSSGTGPPCNLSCGFRATPLQSPLYHKLIPPSTYSGIQSLTLGAVKKGNPDVRMIFMDLEQLRELCLEFGMFEIWDALEPLSTPMATSTQ
ncbi:hypothetical protein FRC03_002808 [Tulasnella sp. 419]|nr:hypothetical protein FRC03_002808 [Tulasnella sp. 419]